MREEKVHLRPRDWVRRGGALHRSRTTPTGIETECQTPSRSSSKTAEPSRSIVSGCFGSPSSELERADMGRRRRALSAIGWALKRPPRQFGQEPNPARFASTECQSFEAIRRLQY